MKFRSGTAANRASCLLAVLPKHFEFRGSEFHHLTFQGDAIRVSLASTLACPSDLHLADFQDCVAKAIRTLFGKKDFSADAFLESLTIEIAAFRKLAPEVFSSWVKFSFVPREKIALRFLGHGLTIAKAAPNRITRGWTDPARLESVIYEEPTDGGVIYLKGAYRSETAAGYDLTETLDSFVAFLNFWQNVTKGWVHPESARAVFKLGPSFGLFNETQNKPASAFWTNPGYNPGRWRLWRTSEQQLNYSLQQLRAINRKRASNPLMTTAHRCMNLLNSGWETEDEQRWIMLVWSCFEKIFEGSRTPYQTLIHRASKFDQASDVRSAMLLALADHRNDAAHANERSGHTYVARALTSECTSYLIWLIRWLIENGVKFRSREEFIEWTDIPKEKTTLLRRKRLNDLAFSQWHPRNKKSADAP